MERGGFDAIRAEAESTTRHGRIGIGLDEILRHNADKGGANQLGPNLWGMIGEPIGQGRGFAFSDALAKKGGTWAWDNLSEWLTSPRNFA